MILRDFISQVLTDIIGGVEDAQRKCPGDRIVPKVQRVGYTVEKFVTDLQVVDFEVTVRADERSGSEAKLTVITMALGGIKGESGKSGGHSATLRFKVPIALPKGKQD